MAEPARDQNSDIEPDIRPNLRSIQGGGESTPSRANLSAVNNQESNPDSSNSNKPVPDQEQNPSNVIRGPWADNVSGNKKPQKINFMTRLKSNKKWAIGGGIGGASLLSIPLIFMSLLPLKMEMFIKNITDLASTVPSYATEQRLDYLITRALATRLIMKVNNTAEADGKIVFCGTKNVISCSLFATYSNEYFEKKLGITFEADTGGRTKLGGRAKNWTVSLGKSDGVNVEGPLRQITSNSEMKALIRSEVHSKTKKNQIITRFLAKKILMKKYGVTTWRGPPKLEKAVNNLTEARSNVNSNIIKNTVGKVSPRVATYLACLQGEAETCKQLRQKLSAEIVDVPDPAEDPALKDKPDSPEYAAAQKKYDKFKLNKSLISGVADSTVDTTAKGASKFISTKVIAAAGGAAAIVGVLDMVFTIISSIGDGGGALEEVGADMAATSNVGFATEVQTTNDKMKAGDLDIDTIAATTELFDDAEKSPLQQAESGLAVDTSSGITTQCNGPKDDVKVNTKLDAGQLVCPEQLVVRNYSAWTQNVPGWSAFVDAANIWVESFVGKTLVAFGELGSAILQPIIGPAMTKFSESAAGEAITEKVMGVVEKGADIIFNPQPLGAAVAGAANYVGLSAGVRIPQNELMQQGVDEDGTAMGAGATVLSTGQLVAIAEESKKSESQYFENQPLMARIFSLDLSGSFMQQFVSRIPTSASSLARLPMTSFSQLLSGTLTNAATTSSTVNPFNLPMYGYAAGDPVLTADPGVYTEASCAVTAADRLASKQNIPSISLISVYTKQDPCALEKMVVGSALNSEGVTEDQYSLKKPTFTSAAATTAPAATSAGVGTPENVTPKGSGWVLTDGLDYSAIPCAAGTTDDGLYVHPTRGFTLRKCKVAGGSVASIVSENAAAMFAAAKTAGVNLSLSSGFRTYELQAELRASNCKGNVCRPATAKPGDSQHESGLALDIQYNNITICYAGKLPTAQCKGNNGLEWLKVNASKYGYINLPIEAWHWSTSGS